MTRNEQIEEAAAKFLSTFRKLNDAELELQRLRDRVKELEAGPSRVKFEAMREALARLANATDHDLFFMMDQARKALAMPEGDTSKAVHYTPEGLPKPACWMTSKEWPLAGDQWATVTKYVTCLACLRAEIDRLNKQTGLTASQRERIMSAADKIRIEIHKQDVLPRGVLMTIDSKAAEILVALYEKPQANDAGRKESL